MIKKILSLTLVVLTLWMVGCEENATISNNEPEYQPSTPIYKVPPKEEDMDDSEVLDGIIDSQVPADEWTALVSEGVAQFTVVAASAEYDDMARELASDLTARTKAAFQWKSSANKGDTSLLKKNQIVLGDSLTKVLKPEETLTYNGRISRAIKSSTGYLKIHITGNHKDAVAASKAKFLTGCLARYVKYDENKKLNFIVPNPRIFFLEENLKNYANTSPTLFGKDLAEYHIVFPKNMTAIDQYMAKYLLNEIGCNTGYTMKSVTDATSEAECEIVFGKTSRAGSQALYETLEKGQFAIKSEGTKIYVAYENYLVSSDARAALNGLYLREVTEAVDIREKPDYTANCVTKTDESHVRVMTSNIICAGDADGREMFDRGLGITWQQRVQIQGAMMMAYLPDFIGLQEMQNGDTYGVAYMHDELKKIISSEYTFVEYEGMAPNTYWNPIVYRHTVWKLEEKGTMYPGSFDDSMHRWQWARFSKLDDPSEQCIILNLHYPISKKVEEREAAGDAVNAKIKELQETYFYAPLFVTGDFNAAEGQDLYNRTVADTPMQNANTGKGAIDLVLYDGSTVSCKMRRSVFDNFIKMTSDHRPFFGDFDLS